MKIDSPTGVTVQDHAADLDRLGNEIVELSADLDAATTHLLTLSREFDTRAGWHENFWSAWPRQRPKSDCWRWAAPARPTNVERIVRGWREVDRQAEARETAKQHARRAFSVYQDDDGMVMVPGTLSRKWARCSCKPWPQCSPREDGVSRLARGAP